jgi:hypothetical protein
MNWFWKLVEIGGGIGLGLLLASIGLDFFLDEVARFVDEILRLRKGER